MKTQNSQVPVTFADAYGAFLSRDYLAHETAWKGDGFPSLRALHARSLGYESMDDWYSSDPCGYRDWTPSFEAKTQHYSAMCAHIY